MRGIFLERGLLLMDMEEGSFRAAAELSATYNQVPVASGFALEMDFKRSIALFDISSLKNTEFSGILATREFLWNGNSHLATVDTAI